MLLWRQAEPCRELPSGTELIRIGDCGSQGRGGKNPETWNGRKSPTGFALGVLCQELLIEYRNLSTHCHDLAH